MAVQSVQEHYEKIRQEAPVRQLSGRPLASLMAVQARSWGQAISSLANLLPSPLRHSLQPWAKKTTQERDRLLSQDQTLVALMLRKGHFEIAPSLVDVDATSTMRSSFAFYGGMPGKVRLQSHRDGSAVEFENVSDATLSRWLVLLHEVAHQELELEKHPFRPTEGTVPPEVAQALGQWVVGQSGMVGRAQRTLSECFADVYAAMLLLSNLEGPAQAAAERQIQALHNQRKVDEQKSAALYVELVAEEGKILAPLDEHATAAALDRMWETRSQWQGLPPAKLKDVALQVASDGWARTMAEDFHSPQGFPLGLAYRVSLLVQTPLERLTENVKMGGLSYLAGANASVAHHDWAGNHPAVQRWTKGLQKELGASAEKHFPGVRRLHLQGDQDQVQVNARDLKRWSDAFTQSAFQSKDPAIRQANAEVIYSHHQVQRVVFEQWIEEPLERSGKARNYPALSHAVARWKEHFRPAAWEGSWEEVRKTCFEERPALPSVGAWRKRRQASGDPFPATRPSVRV